METPKKNSTISRSDYMSFSENSSLNLFGKEDPITANWLQKHDLEKYLSNFYKTDITMSEIFFLFQQLGTEHVKQQLEEMGIDKEGVNKFLLHLPQYKSSSKPRVISTGVSPPPSSFFYDADVQWGAIVWVVKRDPASSSSSSEEWKDKADEQMEVSRIEKPFVKNEKLYPMLRVKVFPHRSSVAAVRVFLVHADSLQKVSEEVNTLENRQVEVNNGKCTFTNLCITNSSYNNKTMNYDYCRFGLVPLDEAGAETGPPIFTNEKFTVLSKSREIYEENKEMVVKSLSPNSIKTNSLQSVKIFGYFPTPCKVFVDKDEVKYGQISSELLYINLYNSVPKTMHVRVTSKRFNGTSLPFEFKRATYSDTRFPMGIPDSQPTKPPEDLPAFFYPIHSAAYFGEKKKILEELKNEVNVNVRDVFGNTALVYAARENNVNEAKILLENGANPNLGNHLGITPLHFAAFNGFSEMWELLVSNGADVTARDGFGNSPQNLKAEGNGVKTDSNSTNSKPVESQPTTLQKSNSAIDSKSSSKTTTNQPQPTKSSSFIKASVPENQPRLRTSTSSTNIRHESSSQVDEFISALEQSENEILHSTNEPSQLPLLEALRRGDTAELERLINSGANTNTAFSNGDNILMRAIRCNFQEGVRLLLSKGADAKYVDHHGNSSLHIAALYGNTNIAKMLLEEGAVVNSVDKNDVSALHHAVWKDAEMVRLLVKRGASTSCKDKKGMSPLHYAALYNKSDAAKILLENSQELVNSSDCNGSSALHSAAQTGSLDVVNLLLEHKANVNAADCNGWTPLHVANNVEVAKILLKFGASTNIKDKEGRTAVDFASKPDIIAFFQREKASQESFLFKRNVQNSKTQVKDEEPEDDFDDEFESDDEQDDVAMDTVKPSQ